MGQRVWLSECAHAADALLSVDASVFSGTQTLQVNPFPEHHQLFCLAL